MKSSQVLLIPVFLAASVHADVLADLSPFLGSSRPDYDPASLQPDSATANPSYAPFSPADSDLGVQQVLGSYPGCAPVKVTFDTILSYTNNAPGVMPLDDDEAWFSASRLDIHWRPRIAYGWFADLGLTQELFRFEGGKAVDFENFNPYLGVVKSIPELDDLVIFSRYDYQRVTTGSISNSDYSFQRIRSGLQKDLLLTTRYQLSVGVDGAFVSANPNALGHNEYTADVRYTYWLADHLSASLSWTGSFWKYGRHGREDWTQIVGLEMSWSPCPNARVFSNIFYTNLNSTLDANDFESFQTGVGFGLNYTF